MNERLHTRLKRHENIEIGDTYPSSGLSIFGEGESSVVNSVYLAVTCTQTIEGDRGGETVSWMKQRVLIEQSPPIYGHDNCQMYPIHVTGEMERENYACNGCLLDG
jgi:hypothetical protein